MSVAEARSRKGPVLPHKTLFHPGSGKGLPVPNLQVRSLFKKLYCWTLRIRACSSMAMAGDVVSLTVLP